MTKNELLSYLSEGENIVDYNGLIGRVESIQFFGRNHINVSVMFPGLKFARLFYSNEEAIGAKYFLKQLKRA